MTFIYDRFGYYVLPHIVLTLYTCVRCVQFCTYIIYLKSNSVHYIFLAETLKYLQEITKEKRIGMPKLSTSDLIMASAALHEENCDQSSIQAERKKRKVIHRVLYYYYIYEWHMDTSFN